MIEIHRFAPFRPALRPDYKRADLEIYGIDHFRQSYAALVFFNLGEVDAKTLTPEDPRCAGRFAVFGHPECAGDAGHCAPKTPGRFDLRRSHPLTAAFKRVTVTEALRRALSDSDTLAITVVAADEDGTRPRAADDPGKPRLLACKGLQLVTFA